MALMKTPVVEQGMEAPPFRLLDVDGEYKELDTLRGEHGTVVMFLCNHCPYVQACRVRLVEDANELAAQGIGMIAIMPNDTEAYPQDSYPNMQRIAEQWALPFPYLFDRTQEVARAYGAVCTPDFFGFDRDLKLRYRGRLDSVKDNHRATDGRTRDLLDAMLEIKQRCKTDIQQQPSMGCSIKWRD